MMMKRILKHMTQLLQISKLKRRRMPNIPKLNKSFQRMVRVLQAQKSIQIQKINQIQKSIQIQKKRKAQRKFVKRAVIHQVRIKSMKKTQNLNKSTLKPRAKLQVRRKQKRRFIYHLHLIDHLIEVRVETILKVRKNPQRRNLVKIKHQNQTRRQNEKVHPILTMTLQKR